jgi:hypothetical protein
MRRSNSRSLEPGLFHGIREVNAALVRRALPVVRFDARENSTTTANHPAVSRLLLLLACVAFTGCNGGTVDRHALVKDGEAIDSLACEGRLLARDVVDGDTTIRFARVHAGDLRQRASNFEDALSERPTVEGIEDDVRSQARKAGRIAELLQSVERSPDDRANAHEIAASLQREGDCP